MKRLLALWLALTVLCMSVPALAEIEVEDKENLPPPMAVTYAYAPPPAIEIVITTPQTPTPTYYQPIKETTTMPPLAPTPSSTAPPTPVPTASTDDIAGDYVKGSVYGPYLSAKELREVKAAVAKVIAACIRDSMTDAQKIVALVNYVYDHCSYAPDWSKNRANTAWGLLVYGEAQCSGYARGMVALFDAVGIESRYIHAAKDDPVNPSHQWNLVRLDGTWYHLDVQMLDSSFSRANKPILLMGSHLSYDESKYPKVAGVDLSLQ